MRAIAVTKKGEQPALHTLPTPKAAAGEVLVRVEASSVNGIDLYMARAAAQGDAFPVVLGKDFAGTVEAVGEGVTRFAPGDHVFGWLGKQGPEGTFAEYVTVPQDLGIARIPAGLAIASAGALGLAGTAALMAVDAVSPESDKKVLIAGATGGVGAYALQLAKARGADVMATAQSSDEKTFVRSLGATVTVDYSSDLSDSVRYEWPDGVDLVIHLAGDGSVLADLLAPGGRMASTMMFGPEQLGDRDATAVAVMAKAEPELLDRLAEGAAKGQIKIPIQRTYRLEDVPQALADFAAGTLGKLAINIRK
jgi:NADPH:quinone reductase-like Zn-dependent oxidoreductase